MVKKLVSCFMLKYVAANMPHNADYVANGWLLLQERVDYE